MKLRTNDKWGAGHFNAPRGNRKHSGVDIVCDPNDPITSLCNGVVTKLGYPYADDLSFRYVEVTDDIDRQWRYFYVSPAVQTGQEVTAGDILGYSQSLLNRYPGITQHWHIEIKVGKTFIDPTNIVLSFKD
jgi:murein DD-endopeptidase MepM/ murein hydrolase activator NlpD